MKTHSQNVLGWYDSGNPGDCSSHLESTGIMYVPLQVLMLRTAVEHRRQVLSLQFFQQHHLCNFRNTRERDGHFSIALSTLSTERERGKRKTGFSHCTKTVPVKSHNDFSRHLVEKGVV